MFFLIKDRELVNVFRCGWEGVRRVEDVGSGREDDVVFGVRF